MDENTKTASVDENTKLSQGELITLDDPTPGRSPLLPVRHAQADFFVCDVFDSAFKGDTASMEHPIFSLSKKPDMKVRRYENGVNWAEVRPGFKGLATVFDRDILIYCISQLMAAINVGKPVSPKLRLQAHDLLIATNRDTSGRGYLQLRDALERLQQTQIATNIVTGGIETLDMFSLIDRARIVRETRDGRMQEVEITLSEWVFQAVEAHEILTLDRRYFQLAKPLERRLYELARKHAGHQANGWKIGMEKLRNKCGATSNIRDFRRMMKAIIEDDQLHDHMPGYSFEIQADIVIVMPKTMKGKRLPTVELRLRPDSYEYGRALAPGWDIYAIESDWRGWCERKAIAPRNADAHFLAFCKRRGRAGFKP